MEGGHRGGEGTVSWSDVRGDELTEARGTPDSKDPWA